MIARRRLLSSPTIWGRLFPLFKEPHHLLSSVSHTSNVVIHTQNQETLTTDKTTPNTSNSHISQHHLKKPISKIPTLSQELTDPTRISDHFDPTRVTEALLTHRNDPDSALNYFKLVEMKCKSINRNDPLCVLLEILATSEAHHHVLGRKINVLVCQIQGFIGPGFVDQLLGVVKRFDFELNSVVFSELLVSFVNACRFGDAVKCYNRMG